jgi:hypothetical protein
MGYLATPMLKPRSFIVFKRYSKAIEHFYEGRLPLLVISLLYLCFLRRVNMEAIANGRVAQEITLYGVANP